MPSNKRFKLTPLSIILRMHSVKELKRIYSEISEDEDVDGLSHADLVKRISEFTTLNKLLETWEDKAFANTTTLRFIKYTDQITGENITDGTKRIKASLGAEWDRAKSRTSFPGSLNDPGDILMINERGKKIYFLFLMPGKSKEIIEELTVSNLAQPAFALAVWHNDTGILQIRGIEVRSIIESKFILMLTKDKIPPTTSKLEVTNDIEFQDLKKLVNGKARRSRYKNAEEDVNEISMASQADVELDDTKRAQQLIKDGYNKDRSAIDFNFNKKQYVLWVGYKEGSFWIRKGDVNEELLDYLQSKLAGK